MIEPEEVSIAKIDNLKCTDTLHLKTILAQNDHLPIKVMLLNPRSINSMKKFGEFITLLGFLDCVLDIVANHGFVIAFNKSIR